MKYLKTYNESLEILDITPMQIRVMEREMGEWVIDVCDISLELNDYKVAPYGDTKPIIQMKMPMEKMFQEKYPEIWSKFIEQKSSKRACKDISEYIHQLHGDKLSDDEYHQMYADIYNLHPSFKKFFQARWKEYDLDNPHYKY